jgi:hypothetical protein
MLSSKTPSASTAVFTINGEGEFSMKQVGEYVFTPLSAKALDGKLSIPDGQVRDGAFLLAVRNSNRTLPTLVNAELRIIPSGSQTTQLLDFPKATPRMIGNKEKAINTFQNGKYRIGWNYEVVDGTAWRFEALWIRNNMQFRIKHDEGYHGNGEPLGDAGKEFYLEISRRYLHKILPQIQARIACVDQLPAR